MNKKKLPRAVTRTADDMRRAGSASLSQGSDSNSDAGINVGALASVPPRQRAKQRETTAAVHAITPVTDEANATQRLSRAHAIVERHSNFSALSGVIPLPLLNVAGVTIIILRMVKRLCLLYGVPYEPGRARALVVGLAAGAVPTTASAVTSSTLVYFIPGVNLLGLAVSSVTASVCTRAVGRRFVEHFQKGATLTDFPVIDRRSSPPSTQ